MNYGAVILAGGKSTRMGRKKSCLQLDGVRFLDQLAYELREFQELSVSVDDVKKHPEITYPMTGDLVPGCGPMGGLYTALKNCGCDALVTVPCDVPLFSGGLARRMCRCLEEETERITGGCGTEAGKGAGPGTTTPEGPVPGRRQPDAVIMATMDGRIHPLCGVYKKSCLPVLEQCIRQQNYRMQEALSGLDVVICQAGAESFRLFNVNTPGDYASLSLERLPADCLAVSGWKNAGKTTLIASLLPLLTGRGLKIAVIKHDGHKYEPDVPGTDSYRFFQAGADISVIYDGDKYTVTRRSRFTEQEITGLAQDVDLILMEGFKQSSYPKIEIIRRETGQLPISGLKGRIAIVSDMDPAAAGNGWRDISGAGRPPVFHPDDCDRLADFIIRAHRNGVLKQRWPDTPEV